MSKRHQCLRFSILLCWMLLTCGLGMFVQHNVARAAALPPGYSLTVTESASTMTYGGAAPTFQAQLTVPAGENPLQYPNQFFFAVDSQDFAPDGSNGSGSTYTFSLNGTSVAAVLTLPVGQHTAMANYFSSVLKATLQSTPVTFTVQKRTPTVYCDLNLVGIFAGNAPVTFTMYTKNGPAVDWQDATYSITFVGTQTFTDSNLTADSSGKGTALTPPVPGSYRYQCAFSGTANFNAAHTTLSTATLIVTEGHHPAIKLYSNPTTIKGGQTVTLDIVVAGASGLPTPTGQVGLNMGGILFTRPIPLGPGGSVEFQIAFPPNPPGKTIWVDYFGDTVYAQTNVSFPLTNPPIPAGSNPSNPKPTPKPTSTATPTPTPPGGSTPAPASTLTANDGTTSGSHPTNPTSNQEGIMLWIGLLGLLVLAAGGSGVLIALRKRARAASTSATTTLPFSEDG